MQIANAEPVLLPCAVYLDTGNLIESLTKRNMQHYDYPSWK